MQPKILASFPNKSIDKSSSAANEKMSFGWKFATHAASLGVEFDLHHVSWFLPCPTRRRRKQQSDFRSCCILPAPVAAPRERIMTMPVHKRGDRWHCAFRIRGGRYRGALPEARTKVQAQKADTKFARRFTTDDTVDRLVRHLSRSL